MDSRYLLGKYQARYVASRALMQKYGLVGIGTIPEKTTKINAVELQVAIGPRVLQVSCRINSCACKRG